MITQGEFFMIRKLHALGLNVSQIARNLHLDRKTVRKYLRQQSEQPTISEPTRHTSSVLDPYLDYLGQRLDHCPELSAMRLLREIREQGYRGSYATLTARLRELRPLPQKRFEVRFETAPGYQAQADFALFKANFACQPKVTQRLHLFTMVLGHSRWLYGEFCTNEKMHTVLEQHIKAFEAFGGVPHQILYDRMKTAVIDEPKRGQVNYNKQLLALLDHYGAAPRACRPKRAKTKGKVERPYRFIRQDFYLGSSFECLEDLNQRLQNWLDEVANVRIHGTTRRAVNEAFEQEKPALQPLPLWPYCPVLQLLRKVSRDGMVSYKGNYYSVPDGTSSRSVELQVQPTNLLIVENNQVIAEHPLAAPHERGARIMGANHRTVYPRPQAVTDESSNDFDTRRFHQPLDLYQAIAERLDTSPENDHE